MTNVLWLCYDRYHDCCILWIEDLSSSQKCTGSHARHVYIYLSAPYVHKSAGELFSCPDQHYCCSVEWTTLKYWWSGHEIRRMWMSMYISSNITVLFSGTGLLYWRTQGHRDTKPSPRSPKRWEKSWLLVLLSVREEERTMQQLNKYMSSASLLRIQ